MWIHWKTWLRGMFPKNQYRRGISEKAGLGQFVKLRALQERGRGGVFEGEELILQCTLCFIFTYTFLLRKYKKYLSCFSLIKCVFLFFIFLTNQKPEQVMRNCQWNCCVIVLWLKSDEWVYLFVSCPKLILVSRFKSNWWAQQGFLGLHLITRL